MTNYLHFFNKKTRNLWVLFLGLALLSQASSVLAETETGQPQSVEEGNFDFKKINWVNYSSPFITAKPFYSFSGISHDQNYVIQGLFDARLSQPQLRCLELIESFRGGTLRVQVMKNPSNPSFSIIQYCTLYNN